MNLRPFLLVVFAAILMAAEQSGGPASSVSATSGPVASRSMVDVLADLTLTATGANVCGLPLSASLTELVPVLSRSLGDLEMLDQSADHVYMRTGEFPGSGRDYLRVRLDTATANRTLHYYFHTDDDARLLAALAYLDTHVGLKIVEIEDPLTLPAWAEATSDGPRRTLEIIHPACEYRHGLLVSIGGPDGP